MVCHFLPTLQIGGPIFTAEQADVLRGKGRSVEQMKWDYEDEGTRLNMCVNGTLDFVFLLFHFYYFSDDMFKTLPLEISSAASYLIDNQVAAASSSSH